MIEKKFVLEGIKRVKLEHYLKKELSKAGFTKAEVVKTPLVTRIIVSTTKPGLAIGKKGQNIRALTKDMEEKFGIENPQLEIKEITNIYLNAAAIVNEMKSSMERGHPWRSVAYRTMQQIEKAGALGAEIFLAGNLAGKGQRKRKQRLVQGYMKKAGQQTKLVDKAKDTAYLKFGTIGIKVSLVHPDTVFPDKIGKEILLKSKEEKEKPAETEGKEKPVEKPAEKTKKKEEIVKEKKEKVIEVKEIKEKPKENVKEEKKEEKVKEKPVVKKEEKAEEKPAEKSKENKTEKVKEKAAVLPEKKVEKQTENKEEKKEKTEKVEKIVEKITGVKVKEKVEELKENN
ncbi:MAG: 30S ribosomal protein S3 [archaeon]